MAGRSKRVAVAEDHIPASVGVGDGNPELDALVNALQIDEGGANAEGWTIHELAQKMNRGDKWVRQRLIALKAEGKIEPGRRLVESLDGRRVYAPVYRLKA